jgi:transcriptional regulator with XRE-family HTH domain
VTRRRTLTGPPRVKRKSAFARWMDRKDAPSAQSIASDCGVSVKTIYNYRRGVYRPSLEVIQVIAELSNGAVTAADWTKP